MQNSNEIKKYNVLKLIICHLSLPLEVRNEKYYKKRISKVLD